MNQVRPSTDEPARAAESAGGAREELLQRVRQAVAEGNRAGGTAELPARGHVGYQGAGSDPVARFVQECTAAGGRAQVVRDGAAAVRVVADLVREHAARRILLGRGAFIDSLGLEPMLRALGAEVTVTDPALGMPTREAFFQADLGVSGVDYLIAETGTVVLASRPEQPRSLSLLPPVHIALAQRGQLLDDLFDLFAACGDGQELPSALSLITGPSKTGDIELRLVTGVHGPGTLHVVLIDPAAPA
jgi:L-lactate dehydrogenase complex protein LldG